ncbi:MAG: ATP synthase F0 subunit B [Acidobacteriales bacterium]|nr:ATP synthase F0 subunit B [Terriglobales bacterium]
MVRRLLLVLALAFSFAILPVVAQEHAQPAQPGQEATAQPTAPSAEGANAAGHEEKKEAGEEDVEEAMKHSSVVKKFGEFLGIKDVNTAYWVFTLLNFAILAGALGKVLMKIVPASFRSKKETIQRSLEEARQASAEAGARLTDIESRLSRIDQEIVSIRAGAEQSAQAEEVRLKAAAEEETRKIVASAEAEIAAAAANARRDLKQYAAMLAIQLAEKQIVVNEATDKRLVNDFAQGLNAGKGGN